MTSRNPLWNRSRFFAGTTAIAALTGSLILSTVPVAQAEDIATAAQTADENTDTSITSTETSSLDATAAMPRNDLEAAGDVLGLGYEQRIALEKSPYNDNDGIVRIYASDPMGGKLLKEFIAAGAYTGWSSEHGSKTLKHHGYTPYHLAVAGDSIYVAQSSNIGATLHRYSADGTLQATTADFRHDHVATALTATVVDGKKYVLIGFNFYGARLLDGTTLKEITSLYSGWDSPGAGAAGDMVSAVALGTDNSGRLLAAVGKFTYADNALWVANALTGETISKHNWRSRYANWQWPSALAFGKLGTDSSSTRLAVGWPGNDGDRIALVDPLLDDKTDYTLSGPFDKLPRSFRFFRDIKGNQRLAVIRGNNVLDPKLNEGIVIGASGGNGFRVYTPENTTADTLSNYYVPGYQGMAYGVRNLARDGVRFQVFASANPNEGCMTNVGLGGNLSFGSPVLVDSQSTSSKTFSLAETLIEGSDGCGSASRTGVFQAQVSLPDGSGVELVKVVFRNNEPVIENEGGSGRFKVALKKAASGSAFGPWIFEVTDRHETAHPVAVPTVSGERLTPAPADGLEDKGEVDNPHRPVYRFTVSGATWKVPGSDPTLVDAGTSLTETVLPAMHAQGSSDGGATWDDLGTIIPKTQPTRSGETVVLGDASFDWQTASLTAKNYTQFRVLNGGYASNVVDAPALPIPEDTDLVSLKSVSVADDVYTNGLDQSLSQVTINDSRGVGLDSAQYEHLYRHLYFRNPDTKALITGLGDPHQPRKSTAVSLIRGSYTKDGGSRVAAASKNVYVSTTDPTARAPMVTFKYSGKSATAISKQLEAFNLAQANPQFAGGTGRTGFAVERCELTSGCSPLNISDPRTGPVLFAVDEGRFGIQFRTSAVVGSDSLPLGDESQPATQHPLGVDELEVSQGTENVASLTNTSLFGGSPTFSTVIVANGVRVPVVNRPVGVTR